MHPNPAFRKTSHQAALAFARGRGFGILSVNGPGHPLTAHVPFVLDVEERLVSGHLVASNPVWRLIADNPVRALISVSGPDSYVSPDWYDMPDQVPTWNYVAVNLSGTLSARPQEELHDILARQSALFEARIVGKAPWTMDKMPPDALSRMMRQIRPFTVAVEDVDSTWKLAQNKPYHARLAAAGQIPDHKMGLEAGLLAALMGQAGAKSE